MNRPPRILIVDESAESREVLRTLLERHGATTIEAQRPEQAVQRDVFCDRRQERGAATDELRAAASRFDTPVVILGTLSHIRSLNLEGQFVAKPYHYGPLIRKIEDLLAAA